MERQAEPRKSELSASLLPCFSHLCSDEGWGDMTVSHKSGGVCPAVHLPDLSSGAEWRHGKHVPRAALYFQGNCRLDQEMSCLWVAVVNSSVAWRRGGAKDGEGERIGSSTLRVL